MAKESGSKFIIKLAAILFAITFTATLLLTLCNYITKGRIEKLALENAEKAKQEVISGAEFTKLELDEDIKEKYGDAEVFTATKDDEFAGFCIQLEATGYIGPIDMIVGINPDMSFAGIKIISLSETPGLGAKTNEKDFYGQFAKGKEGELTVVKNATESPSEIQAVTGATISSKAITSAANKALEIAKELTKEGK